MLKGAPLLMARKRLLACVKGKSSITNAAACGSLSVLKNVPHKKDIGKSRYVLKRAMSSKLRTIRAAQKPASAKITQFNAKTAINKGVRASYAPKSHASTTIIDDEMSPRSTAAKILPIINPEAEIGASRYSSSDLWYTLSVHSGVRLLKAMFMEFNAKMPGTIKSRYEPPPVLTLRARPQPKATI